MMEKEKRRYGGASFKDRQSERRDRLVHAAIAVFSRTGREGATVAAICAEAGLTARYFYESFPNREALYLEAYREVQRELLAELARWADPGDPGARRPRRLLCRAGRASGTCARLPARPAWPRSRDAGGGTGHRKAAGASIRAQDDAAAGRRRAAGCGDRHRAALDRVRLRRAVENVVAAALPFVRAAGSPSSA
ncbi:MAG: TetR/AcrR family transcriptional regulator [Rhizomicrobium sp.]